MSTWLGVNTHQGQTRGSNTCIVNFLTRVKSGKEEHPLCASGSHTCDVTCQCCFTRLPCDFTFFLHKHYWEPGIPPLPCSSPLSVSSYLAESCKVVRCSFPFISLYLSPPRWCSLFSDVKYIWGWCTRNICGPGHEVAKD